MKKKSYIILICIIIATVSSYLAYEKYYDYNPVREQYVQEEINRLIKITPTKFTNLSTWSEAYPLESSSAPPTKRIYIIKDKSAIKFKDGSWIYFSIRDGHIILPGEEHQIGPVVLAKNSGNEIFVCYHPFCGGISIVCPKNKECFDTSKGFLKNLFKKIY